MEHEMIHIYFFVLESFGSFHSFAYPIISQIISIHISKLPGKLVWQTPTQLNSVGYTLEGYRKSRRNLGLLMDATKRIAWSYSRAKEKGAFYEISAKIKEHIKQIKF